MFTLMGLLKLPVIFPQITHMESMYEDPLPSFAHKIMLPMTTQKQPPNHNLQFVNIHKTFASVLNNMIIAQS